MTRTRVLSACLAAGALLLAGPADARPGGNTTTRTGSLNTIGVAATASDNSVCSRINVGVETWQCTPVAAASATAFHPLVNIGGSLTWTGYATCEYRERSDGLNNNWTAWTSCGPYSITRSASRSWGIGGTPGSGTILLQWPRIENVETAFATDCVEVRVSVSSSATASTVAESVAAYARFPSSGTNLSGICEGGSAY